MCTDEQELHTEAMRSDEVPHTAEVQISVLEINQRVYQNSRCSSDTYKDIHLTEGGLRLYEIQWEKSAEVIVVNRT